MPDSDAVGGTAFAVSIDVKGRGLTTGISAHDRAQTIRAAIETLTGVKAKAVGVVVLANKSGKESIEGVPVRSLVELLPVAKQ